MKLMHAAHVRTRARSHRAVRARSTIRGAIVDILLAGGSPWQQSSMTCALWCAIALGALVRGCPL